MSVFTNAVNVDGNHFIHQMPNSCVAMETFKFVK